ncbi:hypothetical protein [Arcanobacterium phocae]|uniref:hypothetical protein n=1 Tax=Arcanobacterium phocae TaxID=131112 RepID=UPI001C0F3ADA|nr:hypothetical protein [Arcanobacterium phocae]
MSKNYHCGLSGTRYLHIVLRLKASPQKKRSLSLTADYLPEATFAPTIESSPALKQK